jgi:hypothetical protein
VQACAEVCRGVQRCADASAKHAEHVENRDRVRGARAGRHESERERGPQRRSRHGSRHRTAHKRLRTHMGRHRASQVRAQCAVRSAMTTRRHARTQSARLPPDATAPPRGPQASRAAPAGGGWGEERRHLEDISRGAARPARPAAVTMVGPRCRLWRAASGGVGPGSGGDRRGGQVAAGAGAGVRGGAPASSWLGRRSRSACSSPAASFAAWPAH